MAIGVDLQAKAIDDLKTQINSGSSYIGDEQILTMLAKRAYDDHVPNFVDGWKRFLDDKSQEGDFSELSEGLSKAMIQVATAQAGFSQDFAKTLVESITTD